MIVTIHVLSVYKSIPKIDILEKKKDFTFLKSNQVQSF